MLTLRAALCAAFFSLVLAGCGGGSGGPTPAPPAPPRSAHSVEYGYFGVDGDQIRETSDHVSFVMVPDWSEAYWESADGSLAIRTRVITQLQEAKARGIGKAWVAIGFLVFDVHPGCASGYCYTPRPDAIARLHAFKMQLDALGLFNMVEVLYPVDEPERHGLDDVTMLPLLRSIKAEWGCDLAAIYGDTQSYPGLRNYDVVGKDDYGRGAGVLDELPPIAGSQQWVIVPGGASGLSDRGPDDPRPFQDFAMRDPRVRAIMPFVWFDRRDGAGALLHGIRSNGMAPAYKATACAVTRRC